MPDFERLAELNELRRQVLAQSMRVAADQYRDGLAAARADEFDGAVLALADKLREPEKCRACGQEVASDTAAR